MGLIYIVSRRAPESSRLRNHILSSVRRETRPVSGAFLPVRPVCLLRITRYQAAPLLRARLQALSGAAPFRSRRGEHPRLSQGMKAHWGSPPFTGHTQQKAVSSESPFNYGLCKAAAVPEFPLNPATVAERLAYAQY